MASLNQIAFSYADSVAKSNDIGFIERVKFAIKYWRATLIRQEAERTNVNGAYQQIYVDLLVPYDDAGIVGIDSGYKLLITQNEVPKPVIVKGSDPFSYVGPATNIAHSATEYYVPYIYSPPAEIANSCFDRYAKQIPRYFMVNNKIAVTGNCLHKYLKVMHVFEDPFDALNKSIDSLDCFGDDDEFFIGGHMLNAILVGLRNAEMSINVPNAEVPIAREMQLATK
jgi:hypothetical protein